jgi:hypothetical protein
MLMLDYIPMRQTSNEEIPIHDNYAKHAIIDVNSLHPRTFHLGPKDNSRASMYLANQTRENSQNGFEAGNKKITPRTTLL